MMKCYLVEDEKNLNMLLTFSLKQEGYDVTSFHTYSEAMDHVHEEGIWVVDINLPDGSGLDIVRAIKSIHPKRSVLIISARDTELDRLMGLEIGSDDYITKPFLPRELVLRLKRFLPEKKETSSITMGPYTLDPSKRLFYEKQEVMDLTSKEYDIIELFVTHPNQAFSRELILDRLWGDDYFGSDRVVDDLVRRIRKKSAELPIETVYGYGYRWCWNEA